MTELEAQLDVHFPKGDPSRDRALILCAQGMVAIKQARSQAIREYMEKGPKKADERKIIETETEIIETFEQKNGWNACRGEWLKVGEKLLAENK